MHLSDSERIKIIVQQIGISQNELARRIKIHPVSLSNISRGKRNLGKDIANAIVESYPEFQIEWILTGSGPMLKDGTTHDLPLKIKPNASIPFYEVTAMGGQASGFPDNLSPHQMVTLPHRLQADVCILVGGDSMAPAYTPGDVIAIRKVRGEHIHYGSAYMIETEDGCLLKYIRKAAKDTHVLLVSENPAYDAYDIPKAAIRGLWLVVGVWKRKEL